MLKSLSAIILACTLLADPVSVNPQLVNDFTSKMETTVQVSSVIEKKQEIKSIMDVISNKEFIFEMYNQGSEIEPAHYDRYRFKLSPIVKTSKFYEDYQDIFRNKGFKDENLFGISELKPTHSNWTDWTTSNYSETSNFNAHFMLITEINEKDKTISMTEYDVFDNPKGDSYGLDRGPLDLAFKTDYILDYSEFKNLEDIDCFTITKIIDDDNEVSGKLYSVDNFKFNNGNPDSIGTIKVVDKDLVEMSKPISGGKRVGMAKKGMEFAVKDIYTDEEKGVKWYQLENNSYVGGTEDQIEFTPNA